MRPFHIVQLGQVCFRNMSKRSNISSTKTVYVLGAGFSMPAGYPSQAKILELLFTKALPNLGDIPTSLVKKLSQFEDDVDLVKKFITSLYGNNTAVRLEDVFTLLDHTIANRKSVRHYSWRDLVEVDFAFKRAILFLFHNLGNEIKKTKNKLYADLAKQFLEMRLKANKSGDRISVISLNWDDFLEELVYEQIRKKSLVGKSDIDYCCFTVPLDEETPHVPSFYQKAKGIDNFKVLKLHGSVNWLICPNCDKIYTGIGSSENRWEKYANPRICVCNEKNVTAAKRDDPTYSLQPFFVTPTYLKSFSNAHIQSIWNNAYTELSEATKVVFVGYSLPEADYHFRSLITRAISKDAKIEVVLHDSDKAPSSGSENLLSAYAAYRYSKFFNHANVQIYTDGLESYFRIKRTPKANTSKRVQLKKKRKT